MNHRTVDAMPKAFELLAAAAAFARKHRIPINDPMLVEQFVADAKPRLKAALDDTALIHGKRTENLFEAMVLSLGRFTLFKTEDIGRVHAANTYRAPDFRVVLDNGDQWLIEVKNVRCEDPMKQRATMSASYLASIQSYADAVRVPLRLAFYWSRWSMWTLVRPDAFRTTSGGLRINMQQAVMASELGRLGDMSISTTPPLRLVLGAASGKPRKLDSDGLAKFTIDSVRIYSGDVELTEPKDRQLAQTMFFYGEWPSNGPFAVMDGDEITGVEFIAAPEEPSDQGFDGVGLASRIFSRYFAEQTVKGDQVVQLSGEPAPEWFTPLANWDFKGSRLPLWLLHTQPLKITADDASTKPHALR
jgi:hypothetical protein